MFNASPLACVWGGKKTAVCYKCTSLIGGVSYKCIHILCFGMNFSQVLNQCSKLCNDSDLHSIHLFMNRLDLLALE